MKVLKFGGTSVGTIDSLRNVKRIVEDTDSPVIVVVSALGGLTDCLIATARKASEGRDDYILEMDRIRQRHDDIIDALIPENTKKSELKNNIHGLLAELSNLYTGVWLLNELSDRTLNRIVAYGERMSSLIVSAVIDECAHKDSLDFIRTEQWLGRNIADRQLTEQGIKEAFRELPQKRYVIGGFISRDKDNGDITNLGRGGSDYTAALVAAALDAEELQIWTDVDGFMTSDPRLVPDARVIQKMTFVESMELCSFGAKVIYPPTIYPVFHKNIPIRILNTHNPDAPGTFISDNSKNLPKCIRGVSTLRDVTILTVRGNIIDAKDSISSRAGNALAKAGLSVLVVEEPIDSEGYSVSVPTAEADSALSCLKDEFAPESGDGSVTSIEVAGKKAVIAIVREGINKMEGLGARLVNNLHRSGIDVRGISDGASSATIAIVVDDDKAVEALQLTHDAVINVDI